ncbi:MAG TPA: metalloregulator ArsR/SmtB family transcription factor [Bacteroidales bacterium]|nr:metalloregulator ArsR/SmtB family transcription factor [Bacteroidales bacterium]HPT02540.1 metalloregulator ArsR/SmtB family transcription factor [Bacteroidales bacterium]
MTEQLKLDVVKLEAAASKLRAMAHPMRIAIIELLNNNSKMNVTEIYETLRIEQAAASHHLNILKSKGILSSKRDGKQIHYSLKNETLLDIISCINRCNEIS